MEGWTRPILSEPQCFEVVFAFSATPAPQGFDRTGILQVDEEHIFVFEGDPRRPSWRKAGPALAVSFGICGGLIGAIMGWLAALVTRGARQAAESGRHGPRQQPTPRGSVVFEAERRGTDARLTRGECRLAIPTEEQWIVIKLAPDGPWGIRPETRVFFLVAVQEFYGPSLKIIE